MPLQHGLCFLSHPSPFALAAGQPTRLPNPKRELEGVAPFRVSIFRDHRMALYAGSLCVDAVHVALHGQLETCPFWASLQVPFRGSAGLAGSP